MKTIKSIALGVAVLFLMAFVPNDDTIHINHGKYGSIDLKRDQTLIISGDVEIGNINMSHGNTIIIHAGSSVILKGSLNLDGFTSVYNYGELELKSLHFQGPANQLVNNGVIRGIVGNINYCSAQISNNGLMDFNVFNANCGSIRIGECAKFSIINLSVNTDKVFSGTGALFVHGNLNANALIGEPGLHFYYNKAVNGENDAGLIRVEEYWQCTVLPVIWKSIKFTNNSVEFDVTEAEEIEFIEIQVSRDGYHWHTVKRVETVAEKNFIHFESKL